MHSHAERGERDLRAATLTMSLLSALGGLGHSPHIYEQNFLTPGRNNPPHYGVKIMAAFQLMIRS